MTLVSAAHGKVCGVGVFPRARGMSACRGSCGRQPPALCLVRQTDTHITFCSSGLRSGTVSLTDQPVVPASPSTRAPWVRRLTPCVHTCVSLTSSLPRLGSAGVRRRLFRLHSGRASSWVRAEHLRWSPVCGRKGAGAAGEGPGGQRSRRSAFLPCPRWQGPCPHQDPCPRGGPTLVTPPLPSLPKAPGRVPPRGCGWVGGTQLCP